MFDFIFLTLQKLVPQHFISRCAGYLANSHVRWFKNLFINRFVKVYKVDLSEAEVTDPHDFKSFNQFFTRKLKASARPIDANPTTITSPVDGAIYQLGKLNQERIIQAKNRDFSVNELLGDLENMANSFYDGDFITLYLAPKDYHRIHMPIKGVLSEMIYIPGHLFSVNPITTENLPNLFARNERVVCLFETELGKVAVILVGAMIVGSIHTVWAGQVAPCNLTQITHWHYGDNEVTLQKGEELGHFQLGSTVIVLLEKNKIHWDEGIGMGASVQMGQRIASW